MNISWYEKNNTYQKREKQYQTQPKMLKKKLTKKKKNGLLSIICYFKIVVLWCINE